MPYVRRTWQNAPSSATPLNAAALNNIEEGIEEALAKPGATDAAVEAIIADTGSDTYATLNSAIGAGVASASSRTPGRRWAFLGDSITNGASASNFSYSFPIMAVQIAGTVLASPAIIESGVPGQTVAQMAARVEETLNAGAEGLVIAAGTNDTATTSLASFQSSYQAIVEAARRRGIPVIACTIIPHGAAATTTAKRMVESFNGWLRLWAPSQGVVVADCWAATVDPANGNLLAAYDADGTHPTDLGHYMMGREVAAAMRRAAGPNTGLSFVHAKTTMSIAPNPMMTGGGVSSRPTSWYEQPGGTGAAPAYSTFDQAGVGRWVEMDFDCTAGAGARNLATSLAGTGWAVGDVLAIVGVAQVQDMTGTWVADAVAGTAAVRPQVMNQSAAAINAVAWSRNPGRLVAGTTDTYDLGPYFAPFTVPSGTTGLLLWCGVQLPVGKRIKARFRNTDVINLTALGIVPANLSIVAVP